MKSAQDFLDHLLKEKQTNRAKCITPRHEVAEVKMTIVLEATEILLPFKARRLFWPQPPEEVSGTVLIRVLLYGVVSRYAGTTRFIIIV